MSQLRYWLAAMHLPIPPNEILNWLTVFPNIGTVFAASEPDLLAAGLRPKHVVALQTLNWREIDKAEIWSEQENHHLITLDDVDYPSSLKQISDPPLVLFVQGDKTLLQHAQIGVVGSRSPTPTGLKNAEQFAYALAEAGLAITSGMALGVDGACHRGALAAKGKTLAVCGTGLHHCYPRSHQKLHTQILTEGGAIISEFPLDVTALAMNFPRRNRIIAGLSLGILVIEAALKSGSLITAKHALEQGREVFAIPGSIHNPLSHGCHHLIRQGAKLVEKAADILEELPRQLQLSLLKVKKRRATKTLTKEYRQLLAQIEYEITPIDVILLRSGLTVSELSSMLLLLELDGYVQSVSGGYVREILNTK